VNGQVAYEPSWRHYASKLGPLWLVLGSLLAGLAAASHYGAILLVIAAGLAVAFAIARISPGVLTGVLIVAIANGVPFVNFNSYVVEGKFRPSDVLFLILFAVLAHWSLSTPEARAYRMPRWLLWPCVALFVWWTFTLLRTFLFDGVPLVRGMLFGRDFLYFTIALPLFVRALQSRREILAMLATLFAGASLYAVAQITDQLFSWNGSWVIHSNLLTEFGGITRFYTAMTEIVIVTFALGLGLAFLAGRLWVRMVGVTLAVLCGVSLAINLTRAIYVALTVGVIVISILWFFGRELRFVRFRRALGVVVVVVSLIFIPSAMLGVNLIPHQISGVVGQRIQVSFTEVRAKTGDFGYRVTLYDEMWHLLGKRWPIGLGFWHPASKPVPELPNQSIRNGDVGLMNGVMTMGVLGTLLIYLPVVGTLFLVLSHRGRGHEEDAWAGYGAGVWIVAAIVGSITMTTLFSLEGLLVTAAVLAAVVRLIQLDAQEEEEEEAAHFEAPAALPAPAR